MGGFVKGIAVHTNMQWLGKVEGNHRIEADLDTILEC